MDLHDFQDRAFNGASFNVINAGNLRQQGVEAAIRKAGLEVCSGGIIGMGETVDDRLKMLVELAQLDPQPDSVPINALVAVEGTPLAGTAELDPFEFVRTIAVARITMPTTMVRLSAGRTEMSAEMQALCFFAGANSIFAGECLLTKDNPGEDEDAAKVIEHVFGQRGMQVLSRSRAEA